jgi:hypothetical protein
MRSAFLVFDLIGRNTGLEHKCDARGFIHPEFGDAEEAVGLIRLRKGLAEFQGIKLRRRRRVASD